MNKEILEVMKESEDFIAAVASAMKSSKEEQNQHYRLSMWRKNKVLVQQLQRT